MVMNIRFLLISGNFLSSSTTVTCITLCNVNFLLPVFKNLCCLRVNTPNLRREEKVFREIFLFIVRNTRNTKYTLLVKCYY